MLPRHIWIVTYQPCRCMEVTFADMSPAACAMLGLILAVLGWTCTRAWLLDDLQHTVCRALWLQVHESIGRDVRPGQLQPVLDGISSW